MIKLADYSKIYIDPDEPLNSLLQKIQSSSQDKLVIIIHNNSPLFTSQINIELMKTYAERVDKELIFITDIEKTQNLLVELGFEVYPDLDAFGAQSEEVASPLAVEEKKPIITNNNQARKSKTSWKGFLFISLFILGAGMIWFYLNFMLVNIQVSPVAKEKVINSQLQGSLQATEMDLEQKIIPVVKKKIDLNKEITVSATGNKEIGVAPATGVITLINNKQRPITLPQGTVVATRNGVSFKTLKKVTVPQVEINKFMDTVVGMKAGKAEVNIEALNKGVAGNVSKGRIVQFVNESYPLKIVNPEPTTGGRNKEVAMITDSDVKRGLKKAKTTLRNTAREKAITKFGSDMICFKDDIQFAKPVLDPQSQAGDLATKLSIKGQIQVTSFGVKKEGLKDLVFKLYKRELGTEFKLRNSEIAIKEIELTDLTSQNVTLQVTSQGQVVGKIDEDKLKKELLGKEVKATKELLEQKAEIAKYQINPANQVNLPQYKLGINLMVQGVDKE